MRTLTWMPLEPLTFGYPRRPWSLRTSLTTIAVLRTSGQPTSGVGSRSTRSSSGWSRSSRRTGCGLKSITPRLTAHARCASSLATSSSAVRPRREGDRRRLQPFRQVLRHPLLPDRVLVDPVDEALHHRRALAQVRSAPRRRRRGSTRPGRASSSRAWGSRSCPGSRAGPRVRRPRASCTRSWRPSLRRVLSERGRARARRCSRAARSRSPATHADRRRRRWRSASRTARRR